MESKELEKLLKKYQHGTCTEEDKQRLFEWYATYDDLADELSAIPSRKLDGIWDSISNEIQHKSPTRRYFFAARVAAVAILLIGITTTVHVFLTDSTVDEPVVADLPIIMPAQGVATLELSTGKTISLESVDQSKDIPSTVAVNNHKQNVLDYTQTNVKAETEEMIYNTVRVPVGGEYKLVLADGSKVHLNSCSSLKYPVHFLGNTREVSLSGEAFFEVSKGSKPFIVKTSDVEIQVHGTSFNVTNYDSEEDLVTALASGKVTVCDVKHGQEYDMSPGVALTYVKSNSCVKSEKVDINEYTCWTDGVLKFNDMRIEDIMLKLKRWYGYDVTYEDESIKNRRLSGVARKVRPMNDMLEIMQKVTGLQFAISGTCITVDKKRPV